MGFHIYTDKWWRNPKHAVTAEATLVEVKEPKRPDGVVTSGPYNPAPSGMFQEVWADVTDPATGQVVRAHGDLYFTFQPFQVGQRLKVRWSAKRKEIDAYNEKTAPPDEWAREASSPSPLAGQGLSGDQAARVQQALGALGLGSVGGVQVVRLGGTTARQTDHIAELERLADLHDRGALTDAEFEQQKRLILGE